MNYKELKKLIDLINEYGMSVDEVIYMLNKQVTLAVEKKPVLDFKALNSWIAEHES